MDRVDKALVTTAKQYITEYGQDANSNYYSSTMSFVAVLSLSLIQVIGVSEPLLGTSTQISTFTQIFSSERHLKQEWKKS